MLDGLFLHEALAVILHRTNAHRLMRLAGRQVAILVALQTQELEAAISSLIISRRINSIPTTTPSSSTLIVGVVVNDRAVK
jgi:hypothetical protein